MSAKKVAGIEEYFSLFPAEVQRRLTAISALFRKIYPPVQTSIRYGIAAYKIGDEYLYIAAYKKHIGMYPMYGLKELESAVAPYRGKGTKDSLHFLHSAPLPMELIGKIIAAKASK